MIVIEIIYRGKILYNLFILFDIVVFIIVIFCFILLWVV